jgi:hypothetical protein
MNYYVDIIELETGEVVERMGPMGESHADRCERGVLINLNRDDFCVGVRHESEIPRLEMLGVQCNVTPATAGDR